MQEDGEVGDLIEFIKIKPLDIRDEEVLEGCERGLFIVQVEFEDCLVGDIVIISSGA